MISACTTYVTPLLPVPEKPVQQLREHNFTDEELFILKKCSHPDRPCVLADGRNVSIKELNIMYLSMIRKCAIKKKLLDQYTLELKSVIVENNRRQ